MAIQHSTLAKGFAFAGISNMSVLIFSRFFTNPVIAQYDPVVMSNFGLMMIMVWGLAYMAIAKDFQQVRWLVGVFAIEKLIYGSVWINWLLNNKLSEVYEADMMAGMFYSIYGVNDWTFFVFFLSVFVYLRKSK